MDLIQKQYRILSLEGKDLLNHICPETSLSILDKTGKINLKLFRGFLDYSLEIDKLRKVYKKHMSSARLSFETKFSDSEYPATLALINVTFRYTVKDETGKKVITNRNDTRSKLYETGFYVDGIHYVRYKRSAGSSRNGQCLFIPEPMYDDMMAWSSMDINPDSIKDLTSFEAYISLTLSSVIQTIELKKESLLILKDASSVFKDRVIAIESDDSDETEIKASEKEAVISNKIWDGESLLDTSVFAQADIGLEKPYFSKKGMMLLRNRFFKSCAFNTNLQQFFKDNNITLKDLKGFTLAKDISDIKLVVTDSSIKYLKMIGIGPKSTDKEFAEGCKKWLKQTESTYGIVKTEKRPNHMNGDMVSTNYQIINTLGLTEKETADFLTPSLKYIGNIVRQAMYMRHYINLKLTLSKVDNDDNDDELSLLDYTFEVVRVMLKQNDSFIGTEYYKTFKENVRNAFKKKLAMGRVLVDGTYATILGNGIELLYATTGKCYDENGQPVTLALSGGEIYTKRFKEGPLLAARSPHITMGNIFIPENKKCDLYDRYFNLTTEIICINAIKFNIQQRLNGCDYDSDTVLITDNPILLKAAQKHYENFLVPSCFVKEANSVEYSNDSDSKFRMDKAISDNKIGEIVNLSQFLNSIYWDNINNGIPAENETQKELYNAICSLAVLSSMEIDKAKRQYKTNANKVIERLSHYKKEYLDKHGCSPYFYEHIRNKTKKTCKGNYSIKTSMEYLYNTVYDSKFGHRLTADTDKDKIVPVKYKDLLKEIKPDNNTNFSKTVKAIKELTAGTKKELTNMNKELHLKTCYCKSDIREHEKELYRKYFEEVGEKTKSTKVLIALIDYLDNDDNDEDSLKIKRLLFSAIVLKCQGFLKYVSEGRTENMYELDRSENGDIDIYGYKHKKVLKLRKNP